VIPVQHRAQECATLVPPEFGIEFDVWAADDDAFVSHNPTEIPHVSPNFLDSWLRRDVQHAGFRPLYAVNVKTDALATNVAAAFDNLGIPRDRWFAFDGSYPCMREFREAGLPLAGRISDEEMWDGSMQIWLDRWLWRSDNSKLHRLGPSEKGRLKIHAVSPELHGDRYRDIRVAYWNWLRSDLRPYSVCTKEPQLAKDYWER
jgi:hypothetical protein